MIKNQTQTNGARKYQKNGSEEHPHFDACLEDLRAVRFMPPEKILSQLMVVRDIARVNYRHSIVIQ